MPPFRYPLRVRFAEVDNAGIVYYPRFFHYFHVAFEELFFARAEGESRNYRHVIETRRIGLPAVRVECDFRRPLRFGDLVDVEVSLDRLGARSVTLRYRALAGDQPCAEGKVTCAAVDMTTFRSIAIPEDLRRLFESLT